MCEDGVRKAETIGSGVCRALTLLPEIQRRKASTEEINGITRVCVG